MMQHDRDLSLFTAIFTVLSLVFWAIFTISGIVWFMATVVWAITGYGELATRMIGLALAAFSVFVVVIFAAMIGWEHIDNEVATDSVRDDVNLAILTVRRAIGREVE